MTGLNRRQVLAGAGAAGLAMAVASRSSAATLPPFKPRRRLRRRPNFLIIMVDEQRAAPVYESDRLAAWRNVNLPAQRLLRSRSMEFTHHHTMASACQPSRASVFTGHYPSLHGVSQTSGAAKDSAERDLYWLQPRSVPTLGNWFRAAGYRTYWKGKWHISDADLYQPGSYNPVPSFTSTGARDPYLENVYLEAGMLEKYGFTGFIGPEPHGSNPLNSGSSGPNGAGRDAAFAQWTVEELMRLRSTRDPWLLVASFVNPHDITLWGEVTLALEQSGTEGTFSLAEQLQGSNVPEDLFTDLYRQSAVEDLSAKPTAQASFVDLYPSGMQPLANTPAYHRFYYQLQKEVDGHIGTVLKTLTSSGPMYRDTIVIYLSDHGELLGAHGGMFQKWHNAYDEVLRVPFIVHSPTLFDSHRTSSVLTSHADLLPTMLGLAGIDQKIVGKTLARSHTQVRRLVGRDLSGLLLGEAAESRFRNDAVYFMTDDNIFKGLNAVAASGLTYPPVDQPSSVETVIAYLPTGSNGKAERWKYSRYFENPVYWTDSEVEDVQTLVPGMVDAPGKRVAETTVTRAEPDVGERAPAADQFEMYNVTLDPTELTNLAGVSSVQSVEMALAFLLSGQRTAKRLQPATQPWGDGSSRQFPYVPPS